MRRKNKDKGETTAELLGQLLLTCILSFVIGAGGFQIYLHLSGGLCK